MHFGPQTGSGSWLARNDPYRVRPRSYAIGLAARPIRPTPDFRRCNEAPQPTLEQTQSVLSSLAVLPFENMSGEREQDYFADGLAEDIITALSKFRSFAVIVRNSSFIYKDRAADVRQIARELGVRYVLTGSVRRANNRLRITGQLVDGSIGTHL